MQTPRRHLPCRALLADMWAYVQENLERIA